MNTLKKHLLRTLGVGSFVYALLFVVFFFDLDGKLVYYVVEPFLDKHYSNMPRRDVSEVAYAVNKPKYEYRV